MNEGLLKGSKEDTIMLSGFIEKQIKLFRNKCSIKINKAEYSILKGIKLKSQLIKHKSTLLKLNKDLFLKNSLRIGNLKVINLSDINKIAIKRWVTYITNV